MSRSVFNHRRGTTSPTYTEEVLADSPLLWWRLDEASGATATDSSGNSRDGSYVTTSPGAITYHVTGAITSDATNYGVTMTQNNGSGGQCSIQRAASTDWDTNDYTIECWLKPAASNTPVFAEVCTGTTIRWRWFLASDLSTVTFQNSIATHTITQTFSASNWQHFAATWDNGANQGSVYYNGVSIDTSASVKPSLANTNLIFRARPGGFGYNGSIDEMALYTTALSSARIAAHYAAGF